MATFEIKAPDGSTWEVNAPEGATDAQVLEYAKTQWSGKQPAEAPQQPRDVGILESIKINAANPEITSDFAKSLITKSEFARGSGNPLTAGIAQGAAGLFSLPMQTLENILNLSRAGAGSAAIAAGRPDLATPADVRLPGNYQSVLSALSGLGLNTSNAMPESKPARAAELLGGALTSVATGGTPSQAALSAAGQFVGEQVGGDQGRVIGGMVPSVASAVYSAVRAPQLKTAQQQNQTRDRVAADAKKEGLAIPPVQTNPGSPTNQVLQGLVSGKARTEMVASSKNQPVINNIARRELRLPASAELTDKVLDGIRRQAGSAYQAVKDFGSKNRLQMKPDSRYTAEVQTLGGDYRAIIQKFPEIAKNEQIEVLKTTLSGKTISPLEAVELTKKLRADASKNYKAFDDPQKLALADAQKSAASAVEGLLERTLSRSGRADLVKDWKDARTLIAKTYDIESALVGGNVNPQVLARAVQADKQLTGGLKTIANAATEFPKAFRRPDPSNAQQFSMWDMFAGGAGSTAASVAGLSAPAVGAAALAIPATRYATRQAILSGPYQRTMGAPSYDPMLTPDSGLAAVMRGYLSGNMTQ